MLRTVALPALLAIAAVVLAVAIYLNLPAEVRPTDSLVTALTLVALVAIALAISSFISVLWLGARMSRRGDGLEAFEVDMRRRMAKLETRLGQPGEIRFDDTRTDRTGAEHAENTLLAAGSAGTGKKISRSSLLARIDEGKTSGDDASGGADGNPVEDDKVIQFDPGARGRTTHLPQARLIGAKLERALENNRIEAWFQPVVGLPGRKTRFFEAIAYVTDDSDGADTARRIEPAYSDAPEIDRRMLVQSIKLLRTLERSGKNAGVIWRLRAAILGDAHAFSGIERILDANSALATQLVTRIEYRDYAALDQAQIDRLHRFLELGYPLAIANCPGSAEARELLQTSLFTMFFIDVSQIITNAGEERPIHRVIANDRNYADAEIIVSGVTDEQQAMALIDHDILLAQGDFFCEPRPMRREGGTDSAVEM